MPPFVLYLISLPVFVLAYLAGRLTEDIGFLFAILGAVLCIVFLMIFWPTTEFTPQVMGYWFLGLLFAFIPAFVVYGIAGVSGYHLGQRHRPPTD